VHGRQWDGVEALLEARRPKARWVALRDGAAAVPPLPQTPAAT